jgi:hypothetical protein
VTWPLHTAARATGRVTFSKAQESLVGLTDAGTDASSLRPHTLVAEGRIH